MAKVYLGLGSNEGEKGQNIQKALISLERWGLKILRSSKLYETEPIGVKDQPWFYNMVSLAETVLAPEEVLKAIYSIELSLKRERKVKWGPRTIDIDILFYDDDVVSMEGLKIPHPAIAERNFVLVPMNEIAPEFVHPVSKKSINQLLKECTDKAIVRPL